MRVCFATALPATAGVVGDEQAVCLLDPTDATLALVWHGASFALHRTEGLSLEEAAGTDRSVRLASTVLTGRSLLQSVREDAEVLTATGHLLVAAQLLGMAEASRDLSVAYASVREQFGQPIGSFQAVKHRCANMAINCNVLHAQVQIATLALRDGWPDAAFNAEACRLLGMRYAFENARGSIQVHGGMGFSAECDAHRYLLRTHLLENVGVARRDLSAAFAARPPLAFAGKPLATRPEVA